MGEGNARSEAMRLRERGRPSSPTAAAAEHGEPGIAPERRGRLASERTAGVVSPTGWHPQGPIELADWAEQGRRFGTIGRAAGWWIGDWLQYGNAKFGERYSRASRITGYDVQTLMNMVYVASRVGISHRRENLSWSHHAEVAALPTEEQQRWLDVAASERLSVRCLRDEIRRARRLVEPPKPRRDEPNMVCPNCGERLKREDGRGGVRSHDV